MLVYIHVLSIIAFGKVLNGWSALSPNDLTEFNSIENN